VRHDLIYSISAAAIKRASDEAGSSAELVATLGGARWRRIRACACNGKKTKGALRQVI
jgi:hypothetical protein